MPLVELPPPHQEYGQCSGQVIRDSSNNSGEYLKSGSSVVTSWLMCWALDQAVQIPVLARDIVSCS